MSATIVRAMTTSYDVCRRTERFDELAPTLATTLLPTLRCLRLVWLVEAALARSELLRRGVQVRVRVRVRIRVRIRVRVRVTVRVRVRVRVRVSFI